MDIKKGIMWLLRGLNKLQFKSLVEETKDNWKKVIKHRFVDQIFAGELAEDIFKFYLKQDYYYLNQSMRNMAILISKLDDVKAKQKLIAVLYSEANLEFSEYEKMLSLYNINYKNYNNFELSYANIAYSNYLIAVSSQNTFAEGLAALIPCYWLYLKMAEIHADKLKKNQNEIYKNWAAVFKRDEFSQLVEDLIFLLEAEFREENFELLKYHFNNSIKFEYQFFNDVYHKKIWKI
jgi:thiaminase/transcriptional activator TenA